MTLPTFLGVGVLRGGTTWLHELLASHPAIYVPERRKEIFFFDLYYERGLEWYASFFPTERDVESYRAVGEITATYFYRPYAPERIARVPSITKLILMVRHPVERAYSHYGLMVKNGEYDGSFEECLIDCPYVIKQGFYSRYLENYYRYYDRHQILALIYELATADILETKKNLANFLDVSAEQFPPDSGTRRVNRSYITRLPFFYALAYKVAWELRYKWNLDGIVNMGKRLGIESLFGEGESFPPIRGETRRRLNALYKDEIEKLESLLELNLDCWKGMKN